MTTVKKINYSTKTVFKKKLVSQMFDSRLNIILRKCMCSGGESEVQKDHEGLHGHSYNNSNYAIIKTWHRQVKCQGRDCMEH